MSMDRDPNDNGGTECKAAKVLKDNDALDVYMLACHGLFSGNASFFLL